MTEARRHANRLAAEKSPYLLQHAYNPVDWYPWGAKAFDKARREDKPVFLSIGYSTCHWCHVMERESFEDREVADLLNRHYVSVKVDREERPDVDHIYMTICQALTGSGGWPLTVIMTPDKKPFFAGTYFPKRSRYGRPGLIDILDQVRRLWETDREQIIKAAERLTDAVQDYFRGGREAGALGEETLREAYRALKRDFDPEYGGFGTAPKFPTPHNLLFLLRYWDWSGEEDALFMAEKTLQAMHDGGIYDHLGYGFSRYAVDRQWLVPHFEKMLYDNALLATAYLEAHQATGRDLYARVAREIFTYVLRDLTSPEGAFFSAEDADSEGEEGKFYVWTLGEIREILGPETGALFCRWYGVTERGNFHGRSILNRVNAGTPPDDAARDRERLEDTVAQARQKLFAARKKRAHPYKDDKVLTSWNALMIAALARGSRVLRERAYLEAAARAAEFLWTRLRDAGGRLLARYRDGEAAYPAYLDDYAFFIWALFELYQADPRPHWLKRALELQEEQNRLFWDERGGGYFFSGRDAEDLHVRPKESYDGGIPSGNSVSALNLQRLGRLTGRREYADLAEAVFRAFAGDVGRYPAGYTFFLTALLFALVPGKEVVVAPDDDPEQVRAGLEILDRSYAPGTLFLYRYPGDAAELERIAPFVREMSPVSGKTTFYVCRDFACRRPTTDPVEARALLLD